jgi:hypothetical protein
MNAPLIPAPYFPNEKSSDSELTYFCVEAGQAMQAVTDILGESGNGANDQLNMGDLAALLRIIQSPLDTAANELHRRSMARR